MVGHSSVDRLSFSSSVGRLLADRPALLSPDAIDALGHLMRSGLGAEHTAIVVARPHGWYAYASAPRPIAFGARLGDEFDTPARLSCRLTSRAALSELSRALGFVCSAHVPLCSADSNVGLLALGGDQVVVDEQVLETVATMLTAALVREPGPAMGVAGQLTALGMLASGLVHDVNNPATYIALAAGQLHKLTQAPSPPTGPLQQLAEGIQESIGQIRDVMGDYRLLASANSDRKMVTVDVEQLLCAATRLTRASRRNNVALQVQIDPLPACPGRFALLGPIVIHLLCNAIQSISANEAHEVRLHASHERDTLHVTVSDTGPGMAQSHVPDAMRPFVTTRDPARHPGLGLPAVQAMVEALGGEVHIDTQVGHGTTVHIHVPLGADGSD